MANRLFQDARKFVNLARNTSPEEQPAAIEKAKNALSSAYANTTMAEKEQLQELQKELDALQ
ncbi:DUF3813 domain-containing protein [Niallia oryzisoli]|uniref:DUF3813 domain-containing protein n=1 Tax=Niallia oryzisoli TaxID=1737571 RepID=A0ABZ2CAF6_9BACI